MLDYIKKRIKETNESLKGFKEKESKQLKRLNSRDYKNTSDIPRCIHGLLGELAVLLEIKYKIEKEISESRSPWVVTTTNDVFETPSEFKGEF